MDTSGREGVGALILLVEDEALIALREVRELELHGYRVRHALDGRAAVTAALDRERPIDLVLMDIDLGRGMDGTEAAEAILAERDIPIVFLSSHTEPEVVDRTERITSYGYVVKSGGIVVLDAAIKMAFRLFRAKRLEHERLEELRSHEERFRRIVETAVEGIWLIDAEGVTDYVNQATCSILGYAAEEMVGRSFLDFMDEAARREALRLFARREAGISERHDFRFRRKDGSDIWTEMSTAAILGKDGGFAGALGMLTDITERRRAAEELRATNEIFSRFIGHSPIYAFIKEVTPSSSRVLFASENFKDMIGIPGSAMAGKTMEELFPPDFAAKMSADDWAVVSAGRVLDLDEDLGDRSYMTLKFPMETAGRRLLAGYTIDITERKRAEEALLTKERAIETALDGMAIADLSGTLTYVNPAFLGLWGYGSAAEVLGRKVAEFWRSERDPAAVISALGERGSWRGEMVARRRDGSTFDVELTASTVVGKDGKPVCLLGSFVDITERKRAEEAVRRELEEKELLLREVHHRIKNNIAFIESLLELQADGARSAETGRALRDAIGRIQSVRRIYDSLLRASGYRSAATGEYLGELARSVIGLAPRGERIGLRLDIEDFEMEIGRLFPLGTAMNELLTNAAKYAFPEGRAGLVELSLARAEGEVVLSVRDDGRGLPEGFRVGDSGRFGLRLVEMLARQLGGSLAIDGSAGTRCVMRFPA